ncbi:unnamed protein product, partial [marine sediment metagenome]
STSLTVQMGNGDGTLTAIQSFDGLDQALRLDHADFNGDGNIDIVLGSVGGNAEDIQVLFGNGDGSFGGKITYDLGAEAHHVQVGDVTGDGIVDIIAGRTDGIEVLAGDGQGNFSSSVLIAQANPTELRLADFNNDGLLDILSTNFVTDQTEIILSQGGASFNSTGPVTTGDTASLFGLSEAAAIADINLDGFQDVIINAGTDLEINVFLGNGDGTLKAAQTYDAGTDGAAAIDFSLADFNGDGYLDFTSITILSNKRSALVFGNGDGSFAAAQTDFSS